MPDFDYGNARLRAMKSRLLSRRELDELAGQGNLNALIGALARTGYRPAVEAALARWAGMDCLREAIRAHLVDNYRKLARFYTGQARELVALYFQQYDVYNFKAILRGLVTHASAPEISATLIPVGGLDREVLSELSYAASPRAFVDQAASLGLPQARPLLKLRTEQPGAEVATLEVALLQWYFQMIRNQLWEGSGSEKLLYDALCVEADLTNLLTILRFVLQSSEKDQPATPLSLQGFEELLVGPGHIPFAVLHSMARQAALPAAVESLSGTRYADSLQAGLERYTQTRRVSEFEKALMRYRLHWSARLIAKDPLGIGVVLGYCVLLANEVNNVRLIAHGINLSKKPELIRAELEIVP